MCAYISLLGLLGLGTYLQTVVRLIFSLITTPSTIETLIFIKINKLTLIILVRADIKGRL